MAVVKYKYIMCYKIQKLVPREYTYREPRDLVGKEWLIVHSSCHHHDIVLNRNLVPTTQLCCVPFPG